MRTIEIVGNRPNGEPGRLARALLDYDKYPKGITLKSVDVPRESLDLVVYCRRSPSTLRRTVNYCQQTNTPLAFMSSGISIDDYLPEELEFSLVDMPNGSIDVVRFMADAIALAMEHPDRSITITERHQPSKKDVSGTALKLVSIIGKNRIKIISIRDWVQSSVECGLPIANADSYAVHYFDIEGVEDGH